MPVYNVRESRDGVPPWYHAACFMGIDEAGRGPVLGPMVYGAAIAPLSQADALKTKEFADSKTLTSEKRDQLFAQLQKDDTVDCLVDYISAAAISGAMLGRQKTSLNAIAFESTCLLITTAINQGADLQEIYVDTVGDATHYKDKLSRQFPGIKFTVCPKADALFPIVSAASIAAKVSRDRALEELKDVEGGLRSCFGSGYPADPDTKAWLEGHVHPVFGFPSVARFSWSTCTALMDKHCTKVDWECDEGDQRSLQETLAGGAGRCGTKTTLRDRHSFFRARKLQRVHAGW